MAIVRLLVWTAAAAIAALLVLNVAYCWHGSLEVLPTQEQQEKIFLFTLVLGGFLFILEAALIALAVSLRRRAGVKRDPAISGASRL